MSDVVRNIPLARCLRQSLKRNTKPIFSGCKLIEESKELSPEARDDKYGKVPEKTPAELNPSSIQEHHIDFLLEEEFACNPEFLSFFLDAAKKNLTDTSGKSLLIQPHKEWNCTAARSVTTTDGETDVLVRYRSADEASPLVAILIEDKIRATFQDGQAERYQIRGIAGQKNRSWNSFWTCLVAPEKYVKDNAGFDTRVSIETLLSFFSARAGRHLFKARVLDRALSHFPLTGIQQEDETMTAFRAFYAARAKLFFSPGEVECEEPTTGWSDGQWFKFWGGCLPPGAEILYKAKKGSVELNCPGEVQASLARALRICLNAEGLFLEPIGKGAGLCLHVDSLHHFGNLSTAEGSVQQSFGAVRRLLEFCRSNSELVTAIFAKTKLPQGLPLSPESDK